MKKPTLILLLSLAALLISGCGKKTPDQIEKTPANQSEQPSNENENSISGTIKDLLGMGKSMKCESEYSGNGYISKATTYISNDRSRTDSEMTAEDGQKIMTHSIVDADWVYVWSDQSKNGTKTKLQEIESQQQQPVEGEEESPATNQMADINEKVDFNCSTWNADEKMLTPPSEITFTDIGQQMQQLQNQPQNMFQNACQMCDMIPDPTAKSECQKNCQ